MSADASEIDYLIKVVAPDMKAYDRFLQDKVPNACNTCHTDKTPEWASEAMRHWPERSPWRVE